ncbi:ParB/RepB/Spo0J family partition protein [Niveispirillum sp.]|uniref:ParB/RepB/Spo0J family partition protein n=1 Tax=Niveispirillum sp. TaxID=1917217 RepID=UPI001B4BFB42|nr:ParB/RepB/Spo0J family partition protein [Niveispirillum sp.]MBP7339945.1 ParB/RepB/Spo0J family partition protein [Niveispirillum sp.]
MKLQKGKSAFGRAMDDVAARGDGSLISRDFPRLIEVEHARVRPRADQPRRHFDEDALRQLADSIDKQGLLQPILVRALPDRKGEYEIVAGERRWRAHGLLGRATIHAIVTNGQPEEIALVENLQRVDLSPLEEAAGIQALMERHHYTQEAAAGALGWSRTQVNRVLKLLTLPETVLAECATLHLSRNAMVELALAAGEGEREHLLSLLRRGASVKALREARAAAAGAGEGATQAPKPVPDRTSPTPKALSTAVARLEPLVTRFAASPQPLNPAQRRQLEQLRGEIDRILSVI